VYEVPAEHVRDAHWIKFSPYEPSLHDPVRAKALKPLQKLKATFGSSTGQGLSSPRGSSFLLAHTPSTKEKTQTNPPSPPT
jgi:hypothetical protein